MTEQLEIRPPSLADLPDVLGLRYRVLDEPVGLPRRTEPSDHDVHEDAVHVAAFWSGKLVSTVRLDPYRSDAYLVRRMATDPEYQRRGVGSRVMQVAEGLAHDRGAKKLVLHSRLGAVPFYEKLGFVRTGRVEICEGDQNPEMVKDI